MSNTKAILNILEEEFGEPQHVKAAKKLIKLGINSSMLMDFGKTKMGKKVNDAWKCNTINSLRDYEMLGSFPSYRT